MMPAYMLGQSESKRQQLRRALHHQQAGLALPEGSQLERERHVEAAELDPLSAAQVQLRSLSPHDPITVLCTCESTGQVCCPPEHLKAIFEVN